MKISLTLKNIASVNLVIVLATLLCLNFVFFGLPQQIDPDETFFTNGAMMMLGQLGDPGWYGAPASFLIDFIALFYGVYFLYLKTFFSVSEYWTFYSENYEDFLLIGRLICVAIYFFFLKSIVTLLGKRVSFVFLLSSLTFLTLNYYLLSYASIVRMDVLQMLCIIMVIHSCLKVADGRGWKFYFLSGLFVGLGTAAKYPAVIASVLVIYSAFVDYKSNGSLVDKVKLLLLSGCSSVFGAFLVAPYLFLNFNKVLSDVSREARTEHLSADGLGLFSNTLFYLTEALPQIITWPVYLFTLAAFIYFLSEKNKPILLKLLALFFVSYLVFISSLSLHWVRWALPLLIPTAVFFGYGVDKFLNKPNLKKSFVLILIFSHSFYLNAEYIYKVNRGAHNKVSSYQWVIENLPFLSNVAVEGYTPQLSTSDYNLFIPSKANGLDKFVHKNRRPPVLIGSFATSDYEKFKDAIVSNDVEYILISNWDKRFQKEAERYELQVNFYNRMNKDFALIKSFHSDMGQKVEVFKVK